ncbi:hypothetical protein CK203_066707 [Vitis vinifera]|uniref:Uncharacterized protein n=1 Tax=Vitis vinifera TaxID=29760 RepID=A0A438EVB5_VITVI|nr:hypothetical protein CK203_066707 [Vitis vinifera]
MRLSYKQLLLGELVALEVLQVVSEPRSRVQTPGVSLGGDCWQIGGLAASINSPCVRRGRLGECTIRLGWQHGYRHPTGGCQKPWLVMLLSKIVGSDHVEWPWEVTCCHLNPSFHSAGDGTWAMAGCRDSVEVRGKAIDKLDAEEFRERFCIPDNVAIELLNGRVLVSSEKAEEKIIIFSKEQFNAGLRFLLPALFKEFLHFTKIPPVFIHPNIVRHVRIPALPPTGDGAANSTKGGATGHVVVRGAWAGLLEHPARPVSPNYSLVVPGRSGIEGPPCGLGRKGVLWLSQQIVRDRRQGEAVQDAADRAEPDGGRPGAPRICHQHSPQEDAKRGTREEEERRTLRKAPGQKRDADSPPKKTPAKRRKLVKKNGKDVREPTPPMEFAPPPIIHEAEVMIEEPVNAAPHSISSGSGHLAGLNHSSTSLAAVAPLANLAEEAASVNHTDSRNPDADAAEAVCAALWRKWE